ncbi:MAG: sugar phosphate isomerase/epimerase [Delftia acidovorans]|nr:sugar phosphate isomerase/epimerase [Delftia acidovorans]
MRLAVSSIAWEAGEDEAVARLLGRLGVDAVDVVPARCFADLDAAGPAAIAGLRDWWRDRGIELTGMQSLLFGTSGLNLFAPSEVRERMLGHLASVCRVAGGLGAQRLVFGSPRNRDRGGLEIDQANAVAIAFFTRLAAIAEDHGVVVCLEPNPARYGCNFMRNSVETATVVRAVDRPGVRMQFDTGAVHLNGESPGRMLADFGDLIGHVHASEPDLVPLGDGGCDHAAMAAALAGRPRAPLVSIEMVATRTEPHLQSIARAVDFARAHYGAGPGAVVHDA